MARRCLYRIIPNEKGSPSGKLADAEVIFGVDAGPMNGLKLLGFAIWERRSGIGRNVTFPSRTYSVNGERRSFSLLRPQGDASSQEAIRQVVLDAYSRFETHEDESTAAASAIGVVTLRVAVTTVSRRASHEPRRDAVPSYCDCRGDDYGVRRPH